MDELVSIITPVYNSEKFIADTIQSVIRQSYQNWEMIIVDDCSTDSTCEIIGKFNDSRIQYQCLEKNSGAAVARNVALESAKGNYIAFLDADDMWKQDKLQKQIAFMKDKRYGFTFTAYEMLKDEGKKIIHVPQSLTYTQFMKNTIIGTLTVVLDKRIIGDIRLVDIKKDHDSMTWAKILKSGNIAYGLDESLALYRKVDGSISNNKVNAVARHWKNMREIEQLPFFQCGYYFICYCFNAVKKHYF